MASFVPLSGERKRPARRIALSPAGPHRPRRCRGKGANELIRHPRRRSPRGFRLERVAGIEPAYSAWKAAVLPLYYTRGSCARLSAFVQCHAHAYPVNMAVVLITCVGRSARASRRPRPPQRDSRSSTSRAALTRRVRSAEPPRSGWTPSTSRRCAARIVATSAPADTPRIARASAASATSRASGLARGLGFNQRHASQISATRRTIFSKAVSRDERLDFGWLDFRGHRVRHAGLG